VLGRDGFELDGVGVEGAEESDAGHLAENANVVPSEVTGTNDCSGEVGCVHGGENTAPTAKEYNSSVETSALRARVFHDRRHELPGHRSGRKAERAVP
jgi:hypothetical protein